MSNRSLVILGVLALISVVGAVVVSGLSEGTVSAAGSRPLIQGLDPEEIARVVVATQSGDPVTLEKQGGGFVVLEKSGYPAETGRINDLLRNVLEIETVDKVTDNAENFAELGVTEEGAQTTVKFFRAGAEGGEGELITGVVIGKTPEGGSGAYVRLVNRDEVYLTTQSPWIRGRAMDYVDSQLLSVERDEIAAVQVETPGGSYGLVADPNGTVRLMDLPAGRQAKSGELSQVFSGATSLTATDVMKAESAPEMVFGYRYTCKLKDSTVYTLVLGQNKDKYYATAEAAFMRGDRVTVGQDESEEELREKAELLEASEAAQQFTQRHAGWVYELSKWQYDRLTKSLTALLEEPAVVEEPVAVEESAAVEEPAAAPVEEVGEGE